MCSARANARGSIEHGIKTKREKIFFFGKRVDNVRLRCLSRADGAFNRSKMAKLPLMSLGPSSLCIDEHLVVVIKKI